MKEIADDGDWSESIWSHAEALNNNGVLFEASEGSDTVTIESVYETGELCAKNLADSGKDVFSLTGFVKKTTLIDAPFQ